MADDGTGAFITALISGKALACALVRLIVMRSRLSLASACVAAVFRCHLDQDGW